MLDPTADRPTRPKLPLPLVVLAACAAAVAGPTASIAGAAPVADAAAAGSGAVELTLGGGGKAAKALAARGVRATAVAPAAKRGTRVTLPVRSIAVARSATIALRGGIRFATGRRSLRLRSMRVAVTATRATVSARAGKRRVPFFVAALAKGKAKLDRSETTAALAGAKLALTRRAAKLLRSRLAIGGIRAGGLGRLAVDARSKGGGGSGGGAPGGGPAPGVPQAGPLESEPPILARPAGAVDVTGAALTWRPRESWIQYVNTGEGTSVFGGATNGPIEGSPPLVYSFHGFPLKSGWYDAATGTAAIYFGGGVGFRYSGHGIDFSTANPEIEINGGASRAIFTFDGTDGTKYDSQRGVLVDLHPAAIQKPPGGQIDYLDVPATIPADTGASVFAGLYSANAEFGTLSVTFTAPNP